MYNILNGQQENHSLKITNIKDESSQFTPHKEKVGPSFSNFIRKTFELVIPNPS